MTIFAYGVTGTGKTHTMRGGLKLAERGVIPRLLSHVFRRGRKIARDSGGATAVAVALSYYEIYNDKVFDLLEPPEPRTPAGLPLREGRDGKTVVVGLSERACADLRDFERLYLEANAHRVTAATKLNAHSSRSHAILRVTVTQTTTLAAAGDGSSGPHHQQQAPVQVRTSTASAIDLAGSEDNRRTDNGRERLVESAAINKSLFVLSQCIEAIGRGDRRVPYRESKMTRILSLGQNNGVTVMILNLAPMRSYHLDTLSSLNVSSRAKRIEVREIENEVVYKNQPPKGMVLGAAGGATGALLRQPLRPLSNAHNVTTGALAARAAATAADKPGPPVKAFNVYTDRGKATTGAGRLAAGVVPAANTCQPRRSSSNKRKSDSADAASRRPTKLVRPAQHSLAKAKLEPSISAAQIEAMVERKVAEMLASRAAEVAAAAAPPRVSDAAADMSAGHEQQIGEEVQRRLDALERRIEDARQQGDDGRGRSEGLRFLFSAKQAKEQGRDQEALRFYELALPFFPTQAKLLGKIERLKAKLAGTQASVETSASRTIISTKSRAAPDHDGAEDDGDYRDGGEADVDDESFVDPPARPRGKKSAKAKVKRAAPELPAGRDGPLSPRTRQLLDIVNSRDLRLIRGLHGFGAKKAQDLVDQLNGQVESLAQLRVLPGMGSKTIERAYEGLAAVTSAGS